MDISSDSDSKSHDYGNNCMDQNSSCKVISKPLLPQDLIFNILTFVSMNCLFNSARHVCKTWATDISSFEFFERRARSKHGLYVDSSFRGISSYSLEFKDDDVNGGEFEKIDFTIPKRMGEIICSCDGIMLLLPEDSSTEVFVVNPILKCWLRIPLLNCGIDYCLCITRVTHTTQFKLFHVNVVEISSVVWSIFYVLRIGIDDSWKEIARREVRHIEFQQSNGRGNNLYSITNDEVIVMDIDREIIVCEYPLLPKLMLKGLTPTYLWMGNCLSCIVNNDNYFSVPSKIFTLNFDSGKWSFYHEIGHFDFAPDIGHAASVFILSFCFWIKDHIILGVLLPNRITLYFAYNVKTRQLKKIEGIDEGNFLVLLHTNSLASLPNTLT